MLAPSPVRPPPAPSLPDFKLAEKLGQGAFGSVYKALNCADHWRDMCCQAGACTSIDLSHIPESELPDIMSEIDLLKNLHHPNIVQYRGYARTSTSLYIILEYCENGSLSAIIKKFGRIPESLVGLYTLQVLQGLQYLHDQGVIHRDIKGSNILATKEGNIKLADFGVATVAGGPADSAVVGSPYWMAPEVVDQTGATLSSDIWSLGALVVELLTGKPPYHFLDPMPALFRIVNDDCPPLPEGASAVVRDFLGQCFQKDANLRVGAKKLLRHPWMIAAKRQADQQRRDFEERQAAAAGGIVGGRKDLGRGGASAARPTTVYEEEVSKVQEWNEALKAAPTATRPRRLSSETDDKQRLPLRHLSAQLASSTPATELASALSKPGPRAAAALSTPSTPRDALPFSLIQPSAGTPASRRGDSDGDSDNWDGDFEDGISISKIAALESPASSSSFSEERAGSPRLQDELSADEHEEDEDERGNSMTVRPAQRRMASSGSDTLRSTSGGGPKKGLEPIVEDYSDLVGDDEADPFSSRVSSFREKSKARPQLLRPSDLAALSLNPETSSPLASPSLAGRSFHHSRTPSESSAAHLMSAGPGSAIEQYTEADADDYSDVFGKTIDEGSQSRLASLQLSTRLSSKSWLGDEESDEEDPFAAVEAEELDPLTSSASTFDPWTEGDMEADLAANLARDQLARQCALVEELVDLVSTAEHPDDFEIREAALQLIELLENSLDARTHFVKAHGMLVMFEALRIARSREILSILLRIVNLIVGSDASTLEKVALVGGCPVVMAFSSKRYSREIRLEAALFIGAMCRTSLLTLQMLVSCQGLRTLVEMLDENYNDGKDLVWMAVDGINRVFEMHGTTPRNDFCRILTHEGVLDPLSSALLSLCGDEDELAQSAKVKIVHLFLLFAQSDYKVKEGMARRAIIVRLVKAADLLEPELLATLLKTIKNLSMLPAALEVLQNAGAIETLVAILGQRYRGRLGAEIQNHAVNALFNLCRLSKNRQEEAASAGAIPLLQRIVQDSSPLKQFALPILCDFAHAGKLCRKLLWQHDGVALYLHLLKDTFWVNPALEAILAWLQDETLRVEECLLQPAAIDSLVSVFCKTKSAVFDNLLEPLLKVTYPPSLEAATAVDKQHPQILRMSITLAAKLAVQTGFIKRIVERLDRASKAVVRLNLLRITKTVFDALSDRRDRDKAVKILAAPVGRLAQEDKAVLSRQLAKTLVADFAAIKEESKRLLAHRSMRRAASEGSSASFAAGFDTGSRRFRPTASAPLHASPSPTTRTPARRPLLSTQLGHAAPSPPRASTSTPSFSSTSAPRPP
ncbi:uncharacterized protein JCM10292_002207 [Rhodotorula paludigena]|uniref:uncharacterized protein n=1 Tax=Rhodotorula paludigena TaxID=86838 RepID=UPI003175834F